MIQEKSWYRYLMKFSAIMNGFINFVCVLLLTCQLIAIIIQVFGRYIFNYVPQWAEQFALFCMVWFAMFSVALSVRTDSHVKMEVIDNLVSEKVLNYFKLFGCICTAIFGYVLLVHGTSLSSMTWGNKLSAFRVPVGLQYGSAVAGGLTMIINAALYSIEMFVKYHDKNLKKEENA